MELLLKKLALADDRKLTKRVNKKIPKETDREEAIFMSSHKNLCE
jgi:hypothetical protein